MQSGGLFNPFWTWRTQEVCIGGGGHVRFTTITLQGAWHIRERKSTRPQKKWFFDHRSTNFHSFKKTNNCAIFSE